jgi:predicted dehydrogenase
MERVYMKVKYGIIGLGTISNKFADAVNKVDNVELMAVAARDQTRADVFAKKYKAKKAYGSYADIISDPNVDIIYIGVTHNFHFDIVKECLNNHKAVLCEKPLVLTKKEAEELAALAQKNNTLLMEAMWTRCLPAYRKAQEWVREGRIGEVKLISANFHFAGKYDPESRLYNPKLAGGSLFDLGVYPIEFSTGILAENPVSVTGVAKIAPTKVDESAAVSMIFPGGALASFSCGFTTHAYDAAWIYGTTGKIAVENCCGPMKAELFDGKDKRIAKFEEREPNGFVYETRHCADLFREGNLQSDLIPWLDTITCAGVFDTLRKQWGLI